MQYRRSIEAQIIKDLGKKMVLLAGPRQCGKTTLAERILTVFPGSSYNWDIDEERKLLLAKEFNLEAGLWVFDELHKFRRWKNWLKGVFDQYKRAKKILVTGSARLQVFKKGGDSLQGRYFQHRLHPLTIAELSGPRVVASLTQFNDFLKNPMNVERADDQLFKDLLQLGGFPEPFASSSEQEASRWRVAYGNRMVQEDVRQLHNVRELDRIELLYDRLPEVVSSAISVKRLSFDLEVAFESVSNWLHIFENLYVLFRVPPLGEARIRSVKKQQKVYLWDWARIQETGARLENFVALHLLRFTHWAEDMLGEKLELRYFRDSQGHEVDFILLKNRQPLAAIEVKSSEQGLDKGLKYLLERYRIPFAFQIHAKTKREYQHATINGCKVWMLSVARFLNALV